MYQTTKLTNGLRIVTHDMRQRQSISVGILIGVGGRHETDLIKGAAHFIEHILFKGSEHYSCNEIKEKIEGVGGALNAFTSEENTCYYAKVPSKYFAQAFDILADMVFWPKISPKDVAKESMVICEEIKMYHDLPQYYVLELLDALVWPNHPLGKSLAGTQQTVQSIKRKDLKQFHQEFYAPENIVVSVCGDLDHAKTVRLIKRKLSGIGHTQAKKFIAVTEKQCQPRAHYFNKASEQMHVALGVESYDQNHKDRYAATLMSTILGGNMSSRLFNEVREKRGLAYSISATCKTLQDTGLFLIRAGVDNAKLTAAVEVILGELKKIKKVEVKPDEFLRFRDYLLGQLMLGLEDTMEHMLWIGESVINKNQTKSLPEIVNAFKKITPKDIQRVANEVLNFNKLNLAVVGPVTQQQQDVLNTLLAV